MVARIEIGRVDKLAACCEGFVEVVGQLNAAQALHHRVVGHRPMGATKSAGLKRSGSEQRLPLGTISKDFDRAVSGLLPQRKA